MCHAAKLKLAAALHDQHGQRSIAADLQGDVAVELQAFRNQCTRGGRVTQNLEDGLLVVAACVHALPRRLQLHQRAAHGQLVEQERNDNVVLRHGA